jgi:glycosyltransferase involved in cell wall biosynthesis
METSSELDKPVVVLIGNYPIDRQESMLRFRKLIQEWLEAHGFVTESISPKGRLGGIVQKGFLGKWFGYIDKYLLFPVELAQRLSAIKRKYPDRKVVVHICDHSNAVYAAMARRWFPVLVTCHDLIAVRSARGEETYCPVSGFGKFLQLAILRGLGQATLVVCVSRSTQSDLIRLSGPTLVERARVIPLALNYPYRPLSGQETMAILQLAGIDLPYRDYVLHVGSGLPRKNREALLLSVARIKDSWAGLIVFAGEPLLPAEKTLAESLGLADRVREISGPDNETLLALYNAAHGLIFMSRFEGFGWPILEAQASGCPVICSDRTSVPEVAGDGALIHDPEDYGAIAADILRLQDTVFREGLAALGFKNAQAYSIERMMGTYEEVYRAI